MSASETQRRPPDHADRRLAGPAWRFLALAVVVALPGIVLILVGGTWVRAIGIAVTVMACVPALVALGLLVGSLVSWWVARGKPFA
jgi:hypothetical protein